MLINIVYIIIILIFIFIIYTAGKAINRGIEGKNKNKHFGKNKTNLEDEKEEAEASSITDELLKLNDLYKSGAIDKDEFLKAKKKILDD